MGTITLAAPVTLAAPPAPPAPRHVGREYVSERPDALAARYVGRHVAR